MTEDDRKELDELMTLTSGLRADIAKARATGKVEGATAMFAQDIYSRLERLWKRTRGQ